MSDSLQPKRLRSRAAVLAATLLAGVGLGVLLDRLWLGLPTAARPDPRLLGRWVDEADGTPLEFKPDGTFEYVKVTTARMSVGGGSDRDISRKEDKVTGQYRWAGGGTIEAIEPDVPAWLPVTVVIEGDRLSLLYKDGAVRRYSRHR
jgi:hypothetical protein